MKKKLLLAVGMAVAMVGVVGCGSGNRSKEENKAIEKSVDEEKSKQDETVDKNSTEESEPSNTESVTEEDIVADTEEQPVLDVEETQEVEISERTTSTDSQTIRQGFYVGGEDNVRRLTIEVIEDNHIKVQIGYAGMQEDYSEPADVVLENGEGTFSSTDGKGNPVTGTVRLNGDTVGVTCDGNSILSINGERELKWVNDSVDIMQVY